MKKILLTLVLPIFFTTATMAQDAYEKGVNYFTAGVGFGTAYNNGYGLGWGTGGRGLPLNAAFELGIHDYISVGPYISYSTFRPGVFGFRSDYRINFFSVGAKGSFHYVSLVNDALDLDIDPEKLDLYVSAYLGAEFFTDNTEIVYDNNANADFGVTVGGRYMFSENLGAYTEVGYAALSVFAVGVTLNL